MSKQLSDQANKLWTLITEPSTAKTYRESLDVSWKILKETGNFLWLVLCLSLVGIDWFWENSIAAGRKTRDWVNDVTTAEKPSPEQLLTPETGKKLLETGKSTLDTAIAAARKQLGLSEKPATPAAPSSPPAVATPTPVASTPVTTTAPPAASSPPAPPSDPIDPVLETPTAIGATEE
ncbi:MAG: hypothetical protein Fur0046_09270 [Cyanobacteria bacterium J069]